MTADIHPFTLQPAVCPRTSAGLAPASSPGGAGAPSQPAASADASPNCGSPDGRSSGDSDRPASYGTSAWPQTRSSEAADVPGGPTPFRRIQITETPRRKRVIDGYDDLDLSFAQNHIAILTRDYLLAVQECLDNNEHVASFAHTRDFKNVVCDAVEDHLYGPLQKALDEWRGDTQ